VRSILKNITINKIISIILFILIFLTAFTIYIPKTIAIQKEIINPKIGEVTFIEIPQDKIFKSISLENHKYQVIQKEKPQMSFIPSSQKVESTPISKRIYENPYTYDILKKKSKDIIRIHVPEVYYKNSKEYTTKAIQLSIIYEENKQCLPAPYQPETAYEYVIITNDSFEPIFENYFKDWKEDNDEKINHIYLTNITAITSNPNYWVNGTYGDGNASNSWLSGESPISTNYSRFNDTQAQIRNFLRFMSSFYNIDYCLLGGNKNVVPVRMVCSYAVGNCDECKTWYNDTSHASDMYYACLHYSMNNNTNNRFMENQCCGSPYDLIDWGYELCVGRVLVGSIEHLFNWINKTKAYELGLTQGNYLKNHIVACKNTHGAISNQTWINTGEDEFAADLQDEFPANFTFLNNQNITGTQWNNLDSYVNGDEEGYDGFHIILHEGHGGTLYNTYQPANNDNSNTPNFVYTEGCNSGDFGTDTGSRMEKWIREDDSAFGVIANSASGWFGASTFYVEEMMSQMFNQTTGNHTMCFAQAHNDAREIYGHAPDCVWGMIVKETNFAGDPALEYNWYRQGGTLLIIENKTVSIGDSFNLSILCVPAQPIKAWEFSIEFDNSKLRANSVSEGDLFYPFTTFFNAGNINNPSGNITEMYSLITPSSQGNATATGSCVNISFTSIGAGSSPINFMYDKLLGVANASAYVDITTYNGTINIQSDKPAFTDIQGETGNIFVNTSTPLFNWTVVANTSMYNLQVSNNSTFTDLVINITDINQYTYPSHYSTDGTNITFLLPEAYKLSNYKTYFTRVKAYIKV